MTSVLAWFLKDYDPKDLYKKKKGEYFLSFLALVLLFSLVVVIITTAIKGFALVEFYEFGAWLAAVAAILVIVRTGHLSLAINVFIFGGIMKAVDLMYEPIGLHFYVHASLIIFIAAAVHLHKYQLYITIAVIYGMMVAFSFLPVEDTIYTTTIRLVGFRISIIVGMLMFVFSAFYLSKIVDREIEKAKQLDYLSRTDVLTGIPNRLSFNDCIRSMNPEKPYHFMILDLDHFKSVNDTYGHPVGDQVLIQFAQGLLQTVESYGQAFRLGGEEFAALIEDCDKDQGITIAKAILDHTRNNNFGISIRLTTSIGSVQMTPPWQEYVMDDFYRIADEALYEAKNHGRNCLVTRELV